MPAAPVEQGGNVCSICTCDNMRCICIRDFVYLWSNLLVYKSIPLYSHTRTVPVYTTIHTRYVGTQYANMYTYTCVYIIHGYVSIYIYISVSIYIYVLSTRAFTYDVYIQMMHEYACSLCVITWTGSSFMLSCPGCSCCCRPFRLLPLDYSGVPAGTCVMVVLF